MARGQPCFAQSQSLSWKARKLGGVAVEAKALSWDERTGAATQLMRLPPGFWRAGPAAFSVACEFYVLQGTFSFGDVTYARDSYAYLPAGLGWSGWHSRDGAVVLVMSDGGVEIGAPRDIDGDGVVVHATAAQMTWNAVSPGRSKSAATYFTKALRGDEDSSTQTFLCAVLPHVTPRAPATGSKDATAEIFCLSGSFQLEDIGNGGPGTYSWARGSNWAPPRTETGYSLLVRLQRPRLAAHASERTGASAPRTDNGPILLSESW